MSSICTITAIVVIGLLEYTALKMGFDGVILMTTIAILAGLGGYEAREILKIFKRKDGN